MARRGGPIGVFNGNWKNGWRRDMEAAQDRKHFIIENNKLNFGDALSVLKHHDRNWEEWFDNDDNIPPVIYWTETEAVDELCKRMIERAKVCQANKVSTR